MARHVVPLVPQELSHAVPCLECLERSQLNAWNLFEAMTQIVFSGWALCFYFVFLCIIMFIVWEQIYMDMGTCITFDF